MDQRHTAIHISAHDGQFLIESSAFLEILEGTAAAVKPMKSHKDSVALWIESKGVADDSLVEKPPAHEMRAFTFGEWYELIEGQLAEKGEDWRQLASLALAVTYMREKCRQGEIVDALGLSNIWHLIREALTSPQLTHPLSSTNNSAKGRFLIVPLCSLEKDGYLDQLFRLNIWLPGRPRPIPEFAIHSHQAFAQSWILAGQGTDHSYTVEPVTESASATHAEYSTAWAKGLGYRPDTKIANIWNTGDFVKVTRTKTAIHSRDMTYTIPAGAFHVSEVPPDRLHATLFFFDSHRGFLKDARILGPITGDSFSHSREPTISHDRKDLDDISPAVLADIIDNERREEIDMEQAFTYGRKPERIPSSSAEPAVAVKLSHPPLLLSTRTYILLHSISV